MFKLLMGVVVISIIAGAVVYFIFFHKSSSSVETKILNSNPLTERSSSLDSDKIKKLEDSVASLKSQLDSLTSPKNQSASTPSLSVEARLKALETSVADLKVQLVLLKQASPTPAAQTSTKQPVLFVPLGTGGNSGDRNFISIDGYSVSLNPADYPGYTSMQLEVSLNLNQGVGTANLRLYNDTDKSAVSTTVSTNSSQTVLLTTSGFQLPSGTKTYKLQVQSTQGYQIYVLNARIRVNF